MQSWQPSLTHQRKLLTPQCRSPANCLKELLTSSKHIGIAFLPLDSSCCGDMHTADGLLQCSPLAQSGVNKHDQDYRHMGALVHTRAPLKRFPLAQPLARVKCRSAACLHVLDESLLTLLPH